MIAKQLSYLMEDSREAKRLADKVNEDDFIEQYLTPYIRPEVNNILDIGCGPGIITSALGAKYPKKQVVGMDISPERIALASTNTIGLPNVKIVQGDICKNPYPDKYFDAVYCRFLLEYIAQKDVAFKQIHRICKPGARVILQDLDGQLVTNYPDVPFAKEMNRIMNYMTSKGFDPFVGRKLYHLAKNAGFEIDDVKVESYHLYAGKIDEVNYKLWELKLDIALPQMVRALRSKAKAVQFKKDYLEYLQSNDTFSYSNLITVVARVPKSGVWAASEEPEGIL